MNHTECDYIEGFVSRECRHESHIKCVGGWKGFGFKVLCKCTCHVKEKDASSDLNGASVIQPFGHYLGGDPTNDRR